jgi:hypothetical protein
VLGCLSGNGSLYNLTAKLDADPSCEVGDIKVRLGSSTISGIRVGAGLVGGGIDGNIDIGIDSKFALPPACPPGQIALSDDQGGWVCTPPNLLKNANPAAKVWVLPRFEGERVFRDELFFMNPGRQVANVGCMLFDNRGVLITDYSAARTVGPGGQDSCFGYGPPDIVRTWLLLTSDVPILPTTVHRDRRATESFLQAYSVDCEQPSGYEFVCQFAND